MISNLENIYLDNCLILGISGGHFGLVITQLMSLIGKVQRGAFQSANLNNQMTSVEKVLEYTNVPKESAFESSLGNRN